MRDSAATRKKVLDAAEQAYASVGVEGLTLRFVTERALVNLASINYHFGTKRALAEEMLVRRLDPLHVDRLALLEAAEHAFGPNLRVAHVVAAVVLPGIDRMLAPASGSHLAAFFSRCAADPAPLIRDAMTAQFLKYGERFDAAFVRCMPDQPEQRTLWRVRLLFNATSGTIMNPNAITLLQSLLAEQPALTLADIVARFAAVIDSQDGDRTALREQATAMERMVADLPAFRNVTLAFARAPGGQETVAGHGP